MIRQLSIGSVPALKKNLQSASSTLFYPDSLHCIFTVPVKAREYNQNDNLPISLTEKIQIYWKLLSGSCKNWKKTFLLRVCSFWKFRLRILLWLRCQAKFLTSRHVRMHRVIFYTSNTHRKLMIRAQGLVFRYVCRVRVCVRAMTYNTWLETARQSRFKTAGKRRWMAVPWAGLIAM